MANDVVRVIEADEEIWSAAEREEKGDLLTVEEQMGTVQLNLSKPLERSDNEPIDNLLIFAPTTKQVLSYQAAKGNEVRREINFIGSCCQGINPQDLENLHPRDYLRLQRVVGHFTS